MGLKSFWTNEHGCKDLEFTAYIEERLDKINSFSQKIAVAIPKIREILREDIKNLEELQSQTKIQPYLNLVGVDGSNTWPKRDPYLTTFSVNAVAYLQFKSKKAPARFLKFFELNDIPTSNFSPVYMHLKRDVLEMRTFLRVTDSVNPDVVFMDGSINSQAMWNARVEQLKYSPYVIPNMAMNLYKSVFSNPIGIWSRVVERLKSSRTVWLPKRIVGKSFVSKLQKNNPDLEIPQEATNEIFSLILKPDEFLGPISFEKWVQTSTAKVRSFVKDINTVYYKPPFPAASTIKLEFHKDFTKDLPQMLTTIRKEYSIFNRQISPIIWAHTIAKNENLDVSGLDLAIKRLAITNCTDPTLRNIIQTRFSNRFN